MKKNFQANIPSCSGTNAHILPTHSAAMLAALSCGQKDGHIFFVGGIAERFGQAYGLAMVARGNASRVRCRIYDFSPTWDKAAKFFHYHHERADQSHPSIDYARYLTKISYSTSSHSAA